MISKSTKFEKCCVNTFYPRLLVVVVVFLSTVIFIAVEEQEQSTTSTRQAKSKALEALASSYTKRRIETESDLNEDSEDNRKRISLSGRHSIDHTSNIVRRHQRTEKLTNTKALKRQRELSSGEEEEEEDKHLLVESKPKRNSAPISSHHSLRDSEQQNERTDTGNLCVKRETGKKANAFINKNCFFFFCKLGGRDPYTVVSDSTTISSRRSSRYTTKPYIDYLATGQSSSR